MTYVITKFDHSQRVQKTRRNLLVSSLPRLKPNEFVEAGFRKPDGLATRHTAEMLETELLVSLVTHLVAFSNEQIPGNNLAQQMRNRLCGNSRVNLCYDEGDSKQFPGTKTRVNTIQSPNLSAS